ncbi:MAG: hypothetical protein ABW061_03145 [Polyangiaceae bacterium]
MLLLDDDDELPEEPSPEEAEVAEQLGPEGLSAIDAALLACTGAVQHKVARIVSGAVDVGGFPPSDEYIDLHARRLIGLVRSGKLVGFGNLRRPRFSEARLPHTRNLHGLS